MQTDYVIFMADNMLDRAAALIATSALAAMPVANLQDYQRTSLLRTDGNSAGEVSIDITLAAGEGSVSGVSVVDHNLSLAGSIRVQAWTDAHDGGAQVVDEIIQPYAPVYGYGEQLYGEGLYGGYATLGPFSSYSPRSFLRVISFLQLTAVEATYWRVTLIDSTPDYLQCARIFIGEAWQPITNYSWGSTLTREPQSKKRGSRGGQNYSNPRPGRMSLEFSLDWLQSNDQQRLWAMYLYVETETPVIVIQRPTADSFDRELRSLYCTFDSLTVEAAFEGNHRSPIKLIEAL